jgi:hypothetical protein
LNGRQLLVSVRWCRCVTAPAAAGQRAVNVAVPGMKMPMRHVNTGGRERDRVFQAQTVSTRRVKNAACF